MKFRTTEVNGFTIMSRIKPQPCNHGVPVDELCPYCDGTAEEQSIHCDNMLPDWSQSGLNSWRDNKNV